MRARGICAAVGAAAALFAGAPGAQAEASFVTASGCDEHQGFVTGDDAAVAARLPSHYSAVREPSGEPVLFARAMRCDAVTVGGHTAPATVASFGVVIDSPDGRGCASGAPGAGPVKGDVPPVCNWYVSFWAANDRRVVDWMRDGTPGFPAVYVPGLSFTLGGFDAASGGAPLHFEAPAPSPSAFTMDDLGRPRPGELSVRVGYWADTPQGTVQIAGTTEDLTSGDATGTVRAAPGSEMATMLGAGERDFLPEYSGLAAERIGHIVYRKQVLSKTPRSDSFDGSCSIQGDVAFDPPATNTEQQLKYSYDARGTCTGVLNGREIADAPVSVHHAGEAFASCNGGHTTSPGAGRLTFEDGTSIAYTIDFSTKGTEVDGTLYGDRSGAAPLHASFLTQRTPPDIAAQCAGEGAKTAPLDASFKTQTPLVSDRPVGRFSLSVTPRRAPVGRRTPFVFRTGVAGAVVRFAGRTATTGNDGVARIAVTLRRRGRFVARASKPGFRSARATVVARRRR